LSPPRSRQVSSTRQSQGRQAPLGSFYNMSKQVRTGEITRVGRPRKARGEFRDLPLEEQLRLNNERNREYRKIRAAEDPEGYKARLEVQRVQQLARYAKHKAEGSKQYYDQLFKIRDSTHGLKTGQWDEMLIAQSGRCGICLNPMKSPQVDHDHGTGKVRELLCVGCNTGLGGFRDSRRIVFGALSYLARHGR